jgi:hypothetical protein
MGFHLVCNLFSSAQKNGYSQLLAKYRVVALCSTPTASETAMDLVKRDDSLAVPSLESVPTDMERRISLAICLSLISILEYCSTFSGSVVIKLFLRLF